MTCCNAKWGGYKTAHCSTCCQTFSTPGNFDRHRPGDCRHPADVGLVVLRETHGTPVWGQPDLPGRLLRATIPVYARALRPDHLPVIDGTVAELVTVGRFGDEIHVQWVPRGADLDAPVREATYRHDALVPCVRRSDADAGLITNGDHSERLD